MKPPNRITLVLIVTFLTLGLLILGVRHQLNFLEKADHENSNFDPRKNLNSRSCLPKTMHAYMRTQSVNLDPTRIIIHMDNQIAMIAFGQLLTLDEYENIRPYLAKKWEISSDGLQYTFTLDPEFRFSNGKPVTAEDVVFTFDRLFSKELESKLGPFYFGSAIKRVMAIDPMTVQFTLRERRPSFLFGLTAGATSILPKEPVFKIKNPTEIVSAGPFTVRSFSHDQVVLERNPFHPGFVRLSELIFQFENKAVCDLLNSNQYDVIDAGPYDGPLCDHANYDRSLYPGGNIWFIAFGKNIAPAVRRKLIECSDKSTYLDRMKINNTTAKNLNSLFPSRSSTTKDSIRVPSQNCKLDKKLQLKLLVNTRHQFREHLASIFRKIDHLSLELVPINDLEYRQARASGNYDLLLIEFSGLISNFYLFAFLFQSQTSILSNGYKNTNYDRWTEKLSTAISVEERNQAIQEIESVIQSDPPALFLKQHDNVEWFKKSLKINSEGFFYRNFYSIKTRKDQTICPE